jgi:hypothetical protein
MAVRWTAGQARDGVTARGAAGARRGIGARGILLLLGLVVWAVPGCTVATERAAQPALASPGFAAFEPAEAAFLDSLSRRTFDFFWERTDSTTGLAPDRWPTKSFSSVAAIGFALTAYPIGAERGWITREQARVRAMRTMEFLWSAPQGEAPAGMTGHRGLFYHFLEPAGGARFEDVELSTIDTALLMAGVLFCQAYFDRDGEAQVRALAESLYTRVEWNWAQPRPPTISLGWTPGQGFLPYDWRGYNEAMILMILALGSPTYPARGDVWGAWTEPYRWAEFQGQPHLGFAPLFGHQYSHVWIDFRGIEDDWCREKGIDYFENSRRATLAQRAYAIENPGGWRGYGERLWGLTACDGPVERGLTIDGRERQFHTYWGRGATAGDIRDDGTIAPTAAAGSIVFAPELVAPALMAMREDYGEPLYGRYGFVDALNPTLREPIPVQHGKVDPARGWFDTDYLGIDQGPILCMIENQRDGIVWNTMKRNPHVRRGLEAAGFTGGWLEAAPE